MLRKTHDLWVSSVFLVILEGDRARFVVSVVLSRVSPFTI